MFEMVEDSLFWEILSLTSVDREMYCNYCSLHYTA